MFRRFGESSHSLSRNRSPLPKTESVGRVAKTFSWEISRTGQLHLPERVVIVKAKIPFAWRLNRFCNRSFVKLTRKRQSFVLPLLHNNKLCVNRSDGQQRRKSNLEDLLPKGIIYSYYTNHEEAFNPTRWLRVYLHGKGYRRWRADNRKFAGKGGFFR